MRIITGIARGTKLRTLEGEDTRPTTDRVKESVFNMIQFDLEGRRVLDLFGGSGQLALEALSRGAVSATIVDKNPEAVKIIKENAQKCRLFDKCVILTKEYTSFLSGNKEKYDLIFLDPPYDSDMLGGAMRHIINKNMLRFGGMIVIESDKDDIPDHGELTVHRHVKYGRSYITILTNEVED